MNDEERAKEKYKGYRFWCSEGCGFVNRNHRCEQWSRITYIPPGAIEAIRQMNGKAKKKQVEK